MSHALWNFLVGLLTDGCSPNNYLYKFEVCLKYMIIAIRETVILASIEVPTGGMKQPARLAV